MRKMAERHHYQGNPEPGFKEQITEAVEGYFAQTKRGLLFQPARIFNDFPNLDQNHQFMETVYKIAETIYDHRSPNR